jgi:hypothetical protein
MPNINRRRTPSGSYWKKLASKPDRQVISNHRIFGLALRRTCNADTSELEERIQPRHRVKMNTGIVSEVAEQIRRCRRSDSGETNW